MATTKDNKDKKKVSISTSSKDKQPKEIKDNTDLSQKNSSNVGKGPSGENL